MTNKDNWPELSWDDAERIINDSSLKINKSTKNGKKTTCYKKHCSNCESEFWIYLKDEYQEKCFRCRHKIKEPKEKFNLKNIKNKVRQWVRFAVFVISVMIFTLFCITTFTGIGLWCLKSLSII